MSSWPAPQEIPLADYPTRDGRPIGETPLHRDNLARLIELLRRHFAGQEMVYISGNMLMYYIPNEKQLYVSPDVFVTLGIPDADRDAYFTWVEGKGPDFVVEFTSLSTREEDLEQKFALYRDVLRIREYFVFDPKQEYLRPSLQGYRLQGDDYLAIERVDGRLPSEVLGLHLERDGRWLRLYDVASRGWVPTFAEVAEDAKDRAIEARAEAAEARAQAAEAQAGVARSKAEEANAEAQAARVRKQAREELRQQERAQAALREAMAPRDQSQNERE